MNETQYIPIPSDLHDAICALTNAPYVPEDDIWDLMENNKFFCETCQRTYLPDYAVYSTTDIVCSVCFTDLLMERPKLTPESTLMSEKPMEKSTHVSLKLTQDEYIKHNTQALARKYDLLPEEVEEFRQDWAEEACIQTTYLSLDEYIKLRKEKDEHIRLEKENHHKYVKLTLSECYELTSLLKSLRDRFKQLLRFDDAKSLTGQIEQLEDHISNHTFKDDSSVVKPVPADVGIPQRDSEDVAS